jgi:hypothetical protein
MGQESLEVEINEFTSLSGHTIVFSEKNEKVKSCKADIILAAYISIQASLRLMAKENTNNDIIIQLVKYVLIQVNS